MLARAACLALLAASCPAAAATDSIALTSVNALQFGSFVVFGQGSRTISASGGVSDFAVVPVGTAPVGPAIFTLVYDRGNNSQKAITVVMQLQLTAPPPVAVNGVSGNLSGFTTDLAGYPAIVPGDVMNVTVAGCTTRTCSVTFRIGARLDVVRSTGGGTLTVPIPVNAVLLAAG